MHMKGLRRIHLMFAYVRRCSRFNSQAPQGQICRFQESLEEDLVNSMNTELLQAPLQIRIMDKMA